MITNIPNRGGDETLQQEYLTEDLELKTFSEPKGVEKDLWEEIAQSLDAVPDSKFSVTARSVRDKSGPYQKVQGENSR